MRGSEAARTAARSCRRPLECLLAEPERRCEQFELEAES